MPQPLKFVDEKKVESVGHSPSKGEVVSAIMGQGRETGQTSGGEVAVSGLAKRSYATDGESAGLGDLREIAVAPCRPSPMANHGAKMAVCPIARERVITDGRARSLGEGGHRRVSAVLTREAVFSISARIAGVRGAAHERR